MRITKHLNKAVLVLLLMTVGVEANFNLVSPHSVKKLDVGGTEMVLIQLFLLKDNSLVVSDNEFLGVSQNNEQVSFYMDFHFAPAELKEALRQDSYINDKKKLKKLISSLFMFKKISKKSKGLIKVKIRP